MRPSTLFWPLVQVALVMQSSLLVEGLPALVERADSAALIGRSDAVTTLPSAVHSFADVPPVSGLGKRTSSKSRKKTKKQGKKKSAKKSGSFSGDGTYYTPGLGSCGKESTDKQLIAALNAPQMGKSPNPNANPNCGRYATVKGPKGTVRVKIIDTCPSCESGSLDLSPAAFGKIADFAAGRVPISWQWD